LIDLAVPLFGLLLHGGGGDNGYIGGLLFVWLRQAAVR
jgi:hypothetical protein